MAKIEIFATAKIRSLSLLQPKYEETGCKPQFLSLHQSYKVQFDPTGVLTLNKTENLI